MKKSKNVNNCICNYISNYSSSFRYIYVLNQNRMENIVKEYSYGMDLKGGRVITLKPDTSNKTVIKDSEGKQVENATNLSDEELTAKGYTKEEVAYNSSDVLTEENYEKCKKNIRRKIQKFKYRKL